LNRASDVPAALLIVFILILIANIAACGKKGDPVPRQHQPQARISDLTAMAAVDGVLLKWTLKSAPENDSEGKYFQIWRVTWDLEKDDCPGCPKDYIVLTRAAAADFADKEDGPRSYRYLDRSATRGGNYGYRLELGAPGGSVLAVSTPVEITFKP